MTQVRELFTAEWLDMPYAQQDYAEIIPCLNEMIGAKSVLEVGTCFGQTLKMIARVAAPKAILRAIDLGKLPEQSSENVRGYNLIPHLERVKEELAAAGFDVDMLYGDSHDPATVAWAAKSAPYDVIFIDGDHSYEGVKADWENYSPMGKKIFLHDIYHPDLGVRRLWKEIIKRQNGSSSMSEVVGLPKGIGVIKGHHIPSIKR